MIYYRKTLFGHGPKLTAVQSKGLAQLQGEGLNAELRGLECRLNILLSLGDLRR